MDKTPLKIFELAVSCIDTDNPPKNNTIYLSKAELFAFFKVDDSNKHHRFKEAIAKVQEQAFFEIREEKDKGFKFRRILPIPEVAWTDYDDKVMIRFDQAIMPYLIDLKQSFTQYALSDLVELNSKYSIILYKWLSMNYNQYEHYSFKGGRRAEQVEAYRNPSITVKELRTITDTVNEHKHFPHFENRVLKKGIEEIKDIFKDKVTVITGQSGVGKSSLLNALDISLNLETNQISKALGRGKHTTRHVELLKMYDGYVGDTPGFSSLELEMEPTEAARAYHDFDELAYDCKFRGCLHDSEPHCAVKEAVEQGKISKERYEHYLIMLKELKEKKEKKYG